MRFKPHPTGSRVLWALDSVESEIIRWHKPDSATMATIVFALSLAPSNSCSSSSLLSVWAARLPLIDQNGCDSNPLMECLCKHPSGHRQAGQQSCLGGGDVMLLHLASYHGELTIVIRAVNERRRWIVTINLMILEEGEFKFLESFWKQPELEGIDWDNCFHRWDATSWNVKVDIWSNQIGQFVAQYSSILGGDTRVAQIGGLLGVHGHPNGVTLSEWRAVYISRSKSSLSILSFDHKCWSIHKACYIRTVILTDLTNHFLLASLLHGTMATHCSSMLVLTWLGALFKLPSIQWPSFTLFASHSCFVSPFDNASLVGVGKNLDETVTEYRTSKLHVDTAAATASLVLPTRDKPLVAHISLSNSMFTVRFHFFQSAICIILHWITHFRCDSSNLVYIGVAQPLDYQNDKAILWNMDKVSSIRCFLLFLYWFSVSQKVL